MELLEALELRHSVRSYEERALEPDAVAELSAFLAKCNQESGLHMQLVLDEPQGFGGFMAHYGKFSGVNNYVALVGKKSPGLDETCGYYGEKVVLKAQQMGLNTCWVALTYKKVKSAFQVGPEEKLALVIAIGYGKQQGVPHPSKEPQAVMETNGPAPDWFQTGVRAALLAPTAMNQQKFKFFLRGDTVVARAGMGFYTKVDLGIVKYHFELGAGTDRFRWAD